MNKKYTCPVCGHKVFEGEVGSFEICPICYWEDEAMQLRYPKEKGANHVSLIEAQINYEKHGVSDLNLKTFVRIAGSGDEKDKNWRKLDLKKDTIEEKDESSSIIIYPNELTQLYYWEENYWLKQKKKI